MRTCTPLAASLMPPERSGKLHRRSLDLQKVAEKAQGPSEGVEVGAASHQRGRMKTRPEVDTSPPSEIEWDAAAVERLMDRLNAIADPHGAVELGRRRGRASSSPASRPIAKARHLHPVMAPPGVACSSQQLCKAHKG